MNKLDEIFEKQNPQDGRCPQWAKDLALEFGKHLLEEAAENAKIKEDTLDTDHYEDADAFAKGKSYSYITDMDGGLIAVDTFEIDKQSITEVISKYLNK